MEAIIASWRELAAEALAEAPSPSAEPQTYGLDEDLALALRRLNEMNPPRVIRRDAWREVVRDALRIAREGWAASALALGWSRHDLFGIGPRDDWEFSGLAVWLRGREIVMLDENQAIVVEGDRRAGFERGGMGHGRAPVVAPVMLWDFGR